MWDVSAIRLDWSDLGSYNLEKQSETTDPRQCHVVCQVTAPYSV